ncbi:aspartate aminotransferase family protein [Aliikangiella marina]|uniref:Aspartate aminotransferase family protein n=1 Tax=Aliikangiella marina TaxID=1712262 RepID=A0A545TBU6_9GAMM|nr:pyridoxal-dependent decarboxylase [Aliikangiella marina]TQV74693.1 aspartate aminotransferase family protein [Aliikangiella marina]
MNPRKSDWQNLDLLLKSFAQISSNFIYDLDDKKVAELDVKLIESHLSEAGHDFADVLEHLCDNIIPQLSASRGPRYWGFVTGGATPVATFADWLVSTFDQNLSKDGDSIASEIERQTIRWLCQLFNLPDSFDGLITTGATASNFLGAICARQFAGRRQGINVAQAGMANLSVEVFSATPHASMLKTLGMAGLGYKNLIKVDCLTGSESMDVADLAYRLQVSTAQTKIIIASVGTVTATDFDDLMTINQLAERYDAWVHVDGAFGIFERILEGENLSNGLEDVHSITLDSHKWLNVPYESGVFLTRHLDVLFDSCDVPAPYLAAEGDKPEFMSLGLENSRRFRALPVWMTLLTYGKQGIASWVKRNIDCAKLLADNIAQSPNYELVNDCKLNVVLFRPTCSGLDQQAADEKTTQAMKAINQDGRIFVSPGYWQGKKVIRAAISNWETQIVDIEIGIACLEDIASKL